MANGTPITAEPEVNSREKAEKPKASRRRAAFPVNGGSLGIHDAVTDPQEAGSSKKSADASKSYRFTRSIR